MKKLTALFLPLLIVVAAFAQHAATNVNITNPQTANDFFKIGFAAYQSANYDEALRHFNTAISLDGTRAYFFYNRGMVYRALKLKDSAIADFVRSNEMKPTAEAYYQIGMLKYESGELESAKAEFENAKFYKVDFDKMNFYLGLMAYREGRMEEAAELLIQYTNTVRTNGEAFYFLAMCKAKLGDYHASIENLNLAVMYKVTDWKVYYKYYEIYLAMNDKQNALYNLSMVIELGEHKAEFYEERARLYADLGNKQKAEEDTGLALGARMRTASASNN